MESSNETMKRELNTERTVNTLLWALNEMGVKYLPRQKSFEVNLGTSVEYFDDAITAAKVRMNYLRLQEIQASTTYPKLIEKFAETVDNVTLPQLKASNINTWKEEMEGVVDELVFAMRTINSTT